MKRIKHLETILSIILGLSVIFIFTKNKYLPPTILILSAIGLVSSYLTEKIHWLWMKIAQVMGAIMSRVLLTIIFYVFLFPIAALSKVFTKKDALQLKKTTGNTYFTERNHLFVKEDLENPW